MFDADDDDLDFVPSSGSKLASVFGLEKSAGNGNKSLFYVPPKQPKNTDTSASPKAKVAVKPAEHTAKFSVVIANIVHSFKLEGESYIDQKRVGVAILGNAESYVFQILLYKTSPEGKQEYIAVANFNTDFYFIVQPDNYCSFYDEKKQYWSLVFADQDACLLFCRQLGAARFRAVRGASVVTQLVCSGQKKDDQGSTNELDESHLELTISHQPIDINSVKVYTPIRVSKKVSVKPGQYRWSESLVKAARGSMWSIFVPVGTALPWISDPVSEPTVVEVRVNRRIPPSDATSDLPLPDVANERIHSSSEEGSSQAKGIASTEKLSSGNSSSSKANLISRVARMGQPTLPLKGAVFSNPTDSEDTENEVDSSAGQSKVPLKPKFGKGRSAAVNRHQSTSVANTAKSLPVAPNSALWRPITSVPTAESSVVQYVGPAAADGQMVSVTSTTPQYQLVGTSPTDPGQVSLLVAESRIQNTEMRMNLSRVVDKLDTLFCKVDALSAGSPTRSAPAAAAAAPQPLEANVLLTSVEKLVQDKNALAAEVADKTQKLNELNERVFSLVDTNARILEQNSALLEEKQKWQQGDLQVESSSVQLVMKLEKEKVALREEMNQLEDRLELLQSSIKVLEHGKIELETALEEEKRKLKEKERKVQSLEDDDRELKDLVTNLSTNIGDLEATITTLTSSKADEKAAHEKQLGELRKKYEETIAQQKKSNDIVRQEQDPNSSVTDVKLMMNKVYRRICQQFDRPDTVPGPKIKQVVAEILKIEVKDYSDQLIHKASRTASWSAGPAVNSAVTSETEARSEIASAIAVESPKPVSVGKPTPTPTLDETLNRAAEKFVASCGVRGPSGDYFPGTAGLLPGGSVPSLPSSSNNRIQTQQSEEQSWHHEPPPVPKFDDDEEEDDWLNF